MLNILVACGSGVATSTLAANEVKAVCESIGLSQYKINKCSMSELPTEIAQADVILTTNNYKGDLNGKPYMNIMGFVTGINEDALRQKLGDLLLQINK
ncbi:PTS sugar transporter subunit IIB [Glaesserella sp.]|uniref:PTS sugar transporter subunit IIB n=1 Tax=Glaesserella sp. TaxID=2094731 RepID=UPI0035A05875